MIPFSNAVLTAVVGGAGATEDYDVAASAGAARWSGSSQIYVAEELHESIGAQRIDLLVRTRVEIPYAVGRVVQEGDALTYTYEGAAVTRVAGSVTHAKLVGRVRVVLRDG